ncbi:restriction endonuclease [Paenibacillus sp. FSL L8-0435]|uniref:restriction endonuclease n=1 Tax=Paenibacillus TaxID=44249 RepID=UPI001C8D0A99|nr:restriction endonuclease [Paenibacillus xylanexedens]MBY0118258.1 restriction endonuclease [Paenibacillus xylanexedens]
MTILFSIVLLFTCYLVYKYYKQKQMIEDYRNNALDAISSHEDMKDTLRIGLYNRFKRDLEEEKEEDPLLFERFVAEIMSSVRGGNTYVTKSSGDFGIDIEEHTDEGLYLGQVKCYNDMNLVGFGPIAIIHSQMVKQDAVGGYVVTTSDFTSNARNYAEGLDIDLINGTQLVELWLEHLETKSERVMALNPVSQM